MSPERLYHLTFMTNYMIFIQSVMPFIISTSPDREQEREKEEKEGGGLERERREREGESEGKERARRRERERGTGRRGGGTGREKFGIISHKYVLVGASGAARRRLGCFQSNFSGSYSNTH